MFEGVTHIAAATNIVFTFPIIAFRAGPDMPLACLRSVGLLGLPQRPPSGFKSTNRIEDR